MLRHQHRDDAVARHRLATRLNAAVADHQEVLATPTMVVDLEAFDANAADLVRRAGGTPIRVASKSIRVPELLRRALAVPGMAGILSFTLAEALFLVGERLSDDIVVAYPSVDQAALTKLVGNAEALAAVTLMVDDPAHLELIDRAQQSSAVGLIAPVRVAIDIDAGLRIGSQHVGPKRSGLYDAKAVAGLADQIARHPGLRLVGAMTYEGQVAGVADDVPHQRAKSLAVRGLKAASNAQLHQRRRMVSDALSAFDELEFFNAGGSGSIETSAADPIVTEVAAGSGLLVPGLFDHYRSFEPRPAAFYGLPVTRRPNPAMVTVHGGGLVASGAMGPDRLPIPWAPPGLQLTGLEGAGEVQTPLTGPGAATLQIGDLVWFRHAKAGEVFEHTNTVHLVSGDRIIDSVASYRGLGLSF